MRVWQPGGHLTRSRDTTVDDWSWRRTARRISTLARLAAPYKGRTALALGSLLAATPGDVIVLDARIDQTFALTGADGTPLGQGFLGSSAGARALQLVSQ